MWPSQLGTGMTGEVQKRLFAAAVLSRPESDSGLTSFSYLAWIVQTHFVGDYCAFPFPNVQQGGEFTTLSCYHLDFTLF